MPLTPINAVTYSQGLAPMGFRLRLSRPSENSNALTSEIDTSVRDSSDTNIQVDSFAYARALFAQRKKIALATLGAGIITALVSLLISNTYISTASLLPSGAGDPLSKITGMTGLSFLDLGKGMMAQENSSQLFPSILNSARLREHVLNTKYQFDANGVSKRMSLLEYLDQPNMDDARQELATLTAVSVDQRTGVITLAVETHFPELSQKVAQEYLNELDRFNRTQRKTRATEYEAFLAIQLAETKTTLAKAESDLTEYQSVNRDWAMSSDPSLREEVGRLERDVEIKNRVYLALTQQYEMARGESRKDLPVTQILDKPSLPVIKASPRRAMMTITAMMSALLLCLLIPLARLFLRNGAVGRDSQAWLAFQNEVTNAYPWITRHRVASSNAGELQKERNNTVDNSAVSHSCEHQKG